eukprot:99756_1
MELELCNEGVRRGTYAEGKGPLDTVPLDNVIDDPNDGESDHELPQLPSDSDKSDNDSMYDAFVTPQSPPSEVLTVIMNRDDVDDEDAQNNGESGKESSTFSNDG